MKHTKMAPGDGAYQANGTCNDPGGGEGEPGGTLTPTHTHNDYKNDHLTILPGIRAGLPPVDFNSRATAF